MANSEQHEAADRQGSDEMIDVIIFLLSGEKYACPILDIQEIVQPIPLKPVPKTLPVFCGVFNLRGRIIGAVDLRKQMSDESDSLPCQAYAISETREGLVALLVDRVLKVTAIKIATVETDVSIKRSVPQNFIRGFFHEEEDVVTLIDLKAALGDLAIDQFSHVAKEQVA